MLSSLVSSASRLSLSGCGAAESFLPAASCLQGVLTSSKLGGGNESSSSLGGGTFANQRPMLNTDVLVRFRYVPKKTMSRRYRGHIDMWDKEDGKRECLYPAVERYKRLDWGMYITTVPGRNHKDWKTFDSTIWMREQHVSMDMFSCLKLDRMFTHDIKLPRYIPDDPYEKYNAMPYWKHREALKKNRKLIEKYGNKDHAFGRYYAHALYRGKAQVLPKHTYMPPDYLKTIANNPARTYKPDPATAPPSNEPAPHFQRKKLMFGKDQRPEYGAYKKWNRDTFRLRDMRRREKYLDKPLPLWNQAFHPTVNER